MRNASNKTKVSRQRLNAVSGVAACGQSIAPGGKSPRVAEQGFQQKRHHQFGVYPAFGGLGILVWQPTYFEQLLEPLEGQLDLPAIAVQIEDRLCAQEFFGQRGEKHHVARRGQGVGVQAVLLLGGSPSCPALCLFDQGQGQADEPPIAGKASKAAGSEAG